MSNSPTKSLINSDGSFNLKRTGIQKKFMDDWYHTLMRISWGHYFVIFTLLYLCINSLFATLYFLGGDSILNANPKSYWDAWIFSFQTSTTLGCGYFLPKTMYAHLIVVFDSLSGILFVAISTGMAFARFSRPTSKVLFSKDMIITEYEGEKTLMFRLGNARATHIVDANIKSVVVLPETSKEGVEMKRIYDLELMRSRTPLFTLSWLVVHKIDEQSPIFGMSIDDIQNREALFVLSFTGIEDVFSQTVHGRHIYTSDHIMKAKKFEDILITDSNGNKLMDYSRFNNVIK